MRRTLPFLLAAVSASAASFEVASIKRNPDCHAGQRRPSPGRLDYICVSVRELLAGAFTTVQQGDAMNIATTRIEGGPGWVDTERYDLSAKAEGRPPVQQMVGSMMIALLEHRLKLKTHAEPRETAVFELTLADGPRKLQRAPEASCQPLDLENLQQRDEKTRYCGHGPTRTEAGVVIADWYGITMRELAARVLPPQVGRLVIDRTGLHDRFDLHLEFRPARTDALESGGPNIFAALERVGLRLTAVKAPVDVIVIDHIERPVGN
jgi:uncharacterized protein (TIGR03435 family)